MALSLAIIGPSGSGKTTYSLARSRKFSKVLAVNSDGEFPGAARISSICDLVPALTNNSLVICDDLIKPNNEESAVLRNLLLFHKRHRNIEIHLLIHSVTRNNTFDLLSHVDLLVFTNSSRNAKNFEEVCRLYKVNKRERANMWRNFMSYAGKVYLVVDTSDMEWKIEECELSLDGNGDTNQDDAKDKKRKVYNIISARTNGDAGLAMALFDHIFDNAPLSELNSEDLSLSLVNKKTNRKCKANICDLLYTATTEGTSPSLSVVYMYKYLRKKFSIPDLFLKNSKFISRVSKIKNKKSNQ